MIKGGTGGAKTTTGLHFEKTTSLETALKGAGFDVQDHRVLSESTEVAQTLPKHLLYSKFLGPKKIQWHNQISAKLLPDEALFNIESNKLFIIEKKWQQTSGSVDEKLQTCSFKLSQYKKLVAPLSIEVSYFYVLNDWFKKPRYADVLDYIISSNCAYFFNDIPLNLLELPS